MKRVALLFAVISSLIFGSVSFAAVKAGAACTKAGATSVVSNKKFTCIKSGKKLVWDKGVVVKKTPVQVPEIPKVEPTPTPQPSNLIKSGEECEKLGEIASQGSQTYKCLMVAGLKLAWIDYTDYKLDLTNQGFTTDFANCRIPDARTTKIQRASIAFPAIPDDPAFTSKSTITIAIVPIDFVDQKGNVDPSTIYKKVIEETDQWNLWFARGKSRVNWVVYPDWIRAPKYSSDYNWIHPLSMTSQVQDNSLEIGEELVDLAQTKIDLKNVQDLLFIYPPDVSKIQDSINYQRGMKTKYGDQMLGIYATSLWSYTWQKSLAMWLIHENMHRFGYAGHSPAFPANFSIAHNQAGLARVMNVWDRIVLDWINPGDIYCTDINDLHGETITLVPEEREQNGIQGVAIKINSHELLILESHKQEKWSTEYPSEFYGITAMYVDTTRDTDRSGENFGDDYKGTKFSRTATYVDVSNLKHGPQSEGSISGAINYMLYQGESLTFKGIKVEFLKAGFNDVVKVSRA